MPASAGDHVQRAGDSRRGEPSFNPAMLTAAREARFMTQSELAGKIGVSQPLVARWEAPATIGGDDKRPSVEQSVELADVLDVHPGLLYSAEHGALASRSEFFHRAFKKARRLHVKAAHARCTLIEMRIDRLLELCPPIEDTIPDIDPDNHAGDVEKVAAMARAAMGVPAGPVENLVGVVERCGGLVIDQDLDIDNVDALCRWRHGLPKLFFLNGSKPGDRMRLSLAHELGHTVMHFDRDPDDELAEEQAQRFSAAFLLPAAEVRRDFGMRLDLVRLAALKRKWRVSMQALTYRAHQLGCIDATRYRSIFQQISRKGWRKSEPVEVPRESPTAMKRLITAHIEAGYEEDQLAELMMIGPQALRRLLVDVGSPDWSDTGVRMRIAGDRF